MIDMFSLHVTSQNGAQKLNMMGNTNSSPHSECYLAKMRLPQKINLNYLHRPSSQNKRQTAEHLSFDVSASSEEMFIDMRCGFKQDYPIRVH